MTEQPHPTRQKLIVAALQMFGRDGFQATSTRALAAAADTNISSIAYHFGGKDGLRLACADAVAAQIGQIARITSSAPEQMGRDEARQALRQLLSRLVSFLTSAPAASTVVSFLLRELAQPDSPVLDRLYDTLVADRHRMICALWARATGRDADSEDVRLAVFSLVGQAAYFRMAAPIVQRRMGWDGYPPAATRAITRRLLANLDAMLEADHA